MHSKDDRPDKIGIVTDKIDLPLIGSAILFFEVTEGKSEGNFVKKQITIFLQQGIPVCIMPLNGRNKLFLPKNIKLPPDYHFRINDKETDIIR